MSGDRMDDRATDLEDGARRASSFRQTMVRRPARDNDASVGSVSFVHNSSPIQNSPYRNPTASGYDSPLRLPEVDGGFRTVTSLGQEEVGKEEQSENYVMPTPPGEPQASSGEWARARRTDLVNHLPTYFPSSSRFQDDQRNEMGLSSSPEQTRILSQFSLDPSLRINNGLSSLNRRGDVNGEQGVPNNGGIFHPSSGEYRIEGESRGAKAEGDIPDYSGGVQYRSIQEKEEGLEAAIRAISFELSIFV